jgi:hypothetical protein
MEENNYFKNLGLNRLLVKEQTESYSVGSADSASLKVKDANESVKSGASTFDVSQTSDFLINKVLKNCYLSGKFYLYGSFGSAIDFGISGYVEGSILHNGRSLSISTDDGGSSLSLVETTSHYDAVLSAGGYNIRVGNEVSGVYSAGLTIETGFLNIPQLTTAEASALTPRNGSMYYDTTTNLPKIRVGGTWKTITTA